MATIHEPRLANGTPRGRSPLGALGVGGAVQRTFTGDSRAVAAAMER